MTPGVDDPLFVSSGEFAPFYPAQMAHSPLTGNIAFDAGPAASSATTEVVEMDATGEVLGATMVPTPVQVFANSDGLLYRAGNGNVALVASGEKIPTLAGPLFPVAQPSFAPFAAYFDDEVVAVASGSNGGLRYAAFRLPCDGFGICEDAINSVGLSAASAAALWLNSTQLIDAELVGPNSLRLALYERNGQNGLDVELVAESGVQTSVTDLLDVSLSRLPDNDEAALLTFGGEELLLVTAQPSEISTSVVQTPSGVRWQSAGSWGERSAVAGLTPAGSVRVCVGTLFE